MEEPAQSTGSGAPRAGRPEGATPRSAPLAPGTGAGGGAAAGDAGAAEIAAGHAVADTAATDDVSIVDGTIATAAPATTSPAAAARAAEGPASAMPAPALGSAPFVERRRAPERNRLRPPSPRVALLLFAAIVVAFLLYLGRDALSPFIVGLLLVYLLDPTVELLARARLPRPLAILLVYAIVVFVVVEGLSIMLTPLVQQVSAFATDLPRLLEALDDQLRRFSEMYRGLDLPPELRTAIDTALADLATTAAGFDPGVLLPVFNSLAGLVSSIFGYLIIPVWTFYLLKDRPALTRAFDHALPAEWRADTWRVIDIVARVFGQWVRGQLFLGLTVGVFTYAGLIALGAYVDPVFSRFALLLAIVAGLFELLPIIGPILAAIPAVLLAATAGLEAAIAALVLYLLVQQVENNLLVPKIQGDATSLHPSAVRLALVVGGAIAGLLGAILALPITAAGRDVVRYLFRRLSEEADARATADAPGGMTGIESEAAGNRSPAAPRPGGPPAAAPRAGRATPGREQAYPR